MEKNSRIQYLLYALEAFLDVFFFYILISPFFRSVLSDAGRVDCAFQGPLGILMSASSSYLFHMSSK